MNERNPTLATLHLLVGCFVLATGLFFLWNDAARFVFMAPMFVFLGAVMFSLAALSALPDGPSPARTTVRVVGFLLSAATVLLAVAAIVTEASS